MITRLILCTLFVCPPLGAISRWAVLEAIHQVENPGNSPRRGRRGELGAYQFLSVTWYMHTREPFTRALDRATADRVAVDHYEWLRAGLEGAGCPATPYTVGLAWNCGLEAVLAGRVPASSHGYARRVADLAVVLHGRAEASRPVPPRPAMMVPVISVGDVPRVYFAMR